MDIWNPKTSVNVTMTILFNFCSFMPLCDNHLAEFRKYTHRTIF